MALYNVFLHPLSQVPGPFWARATGIPSWLGAFSGKRHIWLWQQFQLYGDVFRPEPNTVLFRDPQAYAEIYGNKSNVRRSPFYEAFRRTEREVNTLITTDVAEHAKKRKYLNICFTEKLVRSASLFVIKHVDRWHEILNDEIGSEEWSASMDFSHRIDAVIFDIMGDLSFGSSFDIKEPGDNPLKEVPDCISEYMRFYYPVMLYPRFITWIYLFTNDCLLITDVSFSIFEASSLA